MIFVITALGTPFRNQVSAFSGQHHRPIHKCFNGNNYLYDAQLKKQERDTKFSVHYERRLIVLVSKTMEVTDSSPNLQLLQKPKNTSDASDASSTSSLSSSIQEQSDEEKVPSTMPEALQRFFFGPDRGPIIIIGSIISLTVFRYTMDTIEMIDVVVGMATIIFWWFQEHFIHGQLLHSKWNWLGKEIHMSHHEKTYFHVSIDPTPLLLGWLGTAYILLQLTLPLNLALSATICYATAGMWYEWTHYIVHTKVKPKSKFMKDIRNNHIRHHMLDETNWLGFSLPLVDDLLGTNPDVKDVRKAKRKNNVSV